MSVRHSAIAAMFAWLAFCFAVSAVLGRPLRADAHPLGNFTVNHLTRLSVVPGRTGLRYVLDLAEIPTVALERTLDAGGRPTAAEYAAWGRSHAAQIAPLLELTAAGERIALSPARTSVETRPGAAGLRTIY